MWASYLAALYNLRLLLNLTPLPSHVCLHPSYVSFAPLMSLISPFNIHHRVKHQASPCYRVNAIVPTSHNFFPAHIFATVSGYSGGQDIDDDRGLNTGVCLDPHRQIQYQAVSRYVPSGDLKFPTSFDHPLHHFSAGLISSPLAQICGTIGLVMVLSVSFNGDPNPSLVESCGHCSCTDLWPNWPHSLFSNKCLI